VRRVAAVRDLGRANFDTVPHQQTLFAYFCGPLSWARKDSSASFPFNPVSADRSRTLAKIGQQLFLFIRFLLTAPAPRRRLVSNYSFLFVFC